MTITGLCGNVIFIMCDIFIRTIPYSSYDPITEANLSRTGVACFLHCVVNLAWSIGHWKHHSEDPSHIYFKIYLLMLILKVYGTD